MAQTKLTYTSALDLFNTIAERSKKIDKCLEYMNDDPNVELPNLGEKTVLIVEDPTEDISDGSGGRTEHRIWFQVVKYRSTQARTVTPARDIKEECRAVVVSILSFLRNEQRTGNITDLTIDGANMHPIDYFELSWHGFRASISIKTPIDLSFKDADWD